MAKSHVHKLYLSEHNIALSPDESVIPRKKGFRAKFVALFRPKSTKVGGAVPVRGQSLPDISVKQEPLPNSKRRIKTAGSIYEIDSVNFNYEYELMLMESKIQFQKDVANVQPSASREQDYAIQGIIGDGNFGTVCLATHRIYGTTHAIKSIKLCSGIKSRSDYAMQERNFLYACKSPFIVRMRDYFMNADESRLCIVMDYLEGKDLLDHQALYGKFSNERARFYTVQLVLALEFLHNLDLIHRDLKPENIMVGKDGYIKLIDLGFSKQAEIATTELGTLGYKAPEIILRKKYTKAVDWWAVGIIVFEMLTGSRMTPCEEVANATGGTDFILPSSDEIRFPPEFSGDLAAQDFIKRLLQNTQKRRLGYDAKTGSRDVKSHMWFKDVDWSAHYNRQVPAPPILPPRINTKSAHAKNR